MYAWDSPLMKIYEYDYNGDTGDVSNKRLLVDLEVTCDVFREMVMTIYTQRPIFDSNGFRISR